MRRPTPSSAPPSVPPSARAVLALLLAISSAVLVAGCSGTPRPAASSDPTPSPTSEAAVDGAATADTAEAAAGIPPDFPLTSGWRAGLEAPRRGDADLPRCPDDGGDLPDANVGDRLVATWPARERTRQVTLYPDEATAGSAVRDLVGYYRGCPVADRGERARRSTTTVRLTADDDPGAVRWEVRQRPADADGALGGFVLQVVRVGRAVLLDLAGATVDDGRWTRRADAVAADQLTWGAGVVAAMGEL